MSRKRNILYTTWWNMIRRCEDTRSISFHNYGDRGIKVCKEWHDFKCFEKWAFNNGYVKGSSLDRIDFNGNYEPSNCRWVDAKTQANNRRTNRFVYYQGNKYSLSQLCEKLNLNYSRINNRIQDGWDVYKAIEKGNDTNQGKKFLTYNGKTMSQAEWSKELGFSKNVISERLRWGWSVEQALTTPVRKRGSI